MHWATKGKRQHPLMFKLTSAMIVRCLGKNPVQMVYEYCSTNHLPKPLFEDAGVQNGNLFRFNVCPDSLTHLAETSISANGS